MSTNENNILISVGIAAFNEEESIRTTLMSVLTAVKMLKVKTEIIVVASGCIDDTVKEASDMLNNYLYFKIIVEKERKGKSSALNKIANIAKGKFLFFCDADVIVNYDSFNILYNEFVKDESLVLAFSKVEVIQGPSKFWTKLGRSSAQALDAYRSLEMKRGLWMVNGYLFALRATEWQDIPSNIIADDVYIGLSMINRNAKICYLPYSIVNICYPQTFYDYISQKIRNRLARRQLKHNYKKFQLPTKWIGIDFLFIKGLSALKYLPIIIWDSLLVCLAELASIFQYHQSPMWKKIESSKLIQLNNSKDT